MGVSENTLPIHKERGIATAFVMSNGKSLGYILETSSSLHTHTQRTGT